MKKLTIIILLTTCMVNNYINAQQYVGNPGFSGSRINTTDIVMDGPTPYVAFISEISGNISVMKYDGFSWVYVGIPDFTTDFYQSYDKRLSLKMDGSTPYIAHIGSSGVEVMKFDGMNWISLGSIIQSGNDFTFEMNGGQPYVAHRDDYVSQKICLKTYIGGNWINVGNCGFSTTIGNAPIIKFDGSIPYVCYLSNIGYPEIMKFDGLNWISVSISNLQLSYYNYGNYDFEIKNSIPYITYTDVNSRQLYLSSYNGFSWNTIGGAIDYYNSGFSCDLEFRGNNPIIAYGSNGYFGSFNPKLTEFNGTNWIDLQALPLTTNYIDIKLAVYDSIPYLSFRDSINSDGKISVINFPNITNINETNHLSRNLIYPNPSSTTLNLKVEKVNISKIEIYTVTGQKINAKSIEKTDRFIQIDISNLSEGLYFLKVYDKDKIMGTSKFFKM